MTRAQAKDIANKITNEEIQQMFNLAQNSILDWTKPSLINRGMSKGIAWNIFAKDFDASKTHAFISKYNMVREFGEFLPAHLKPVTNQKQKVSVAHQAPVFKKPFNIDGHE